MTAKIRPGSDHTQLLWLVLLLLALVTFLVDLAGWFNAGALLVP
jgi:hypothetical protein